MAEVEPTQLQDTRRVEPPSESTYPYLFGSYNRVMDNRSRLVLPSLFRPWFGQMVVVREWISHSLTLCRPQDWPEIMAHLAETEMGHLSLTEVESVFADHTATSKVDKLGRFWIPPQLQVYAGFKPGDLILVLGAGKRVELWSRQRREEFMTAMLTKSRGRPSSFINWVLGRVERGETEIHAL